MVPSTTAKNGRDLAERVRQSCRPRAQFVQEANVGRLQRPQAVEQLGAQVGGRRPVALRRGLLGQRLAQRRGNPRRCHSRRQAKRGRNGRALAEVAQQRASLLPISQAALAPPSSMIDDPAYAAAIHTIMNTLEACLPYSVPLLSHQTPRMASDPLLHAFQQQMDDGHDDTTHLAAVYLPRYQPEPHVSAEVSRAVRLCDNDYHALRPGMIVQTRQQKGVITGIVQEVQQDGAVQVRVPTRATAAGVVWADMGTREHFVTRGKVAIFTLS
jgi:hypothetical protein